MARKGISILSDFRNGEFIWDEYTVEEFRVRMGYGSLDPSGDNRLIDYSPEYKEDDPQETTDFGI